jgi:hypothetical protein
MLGSSFAWRAINAGISFAWLVVSIGTGSYFLAIGALVFIAFTFLRELPTADRAEEGVDGDDPLPGP